MTMSARHEAPPDPVRPYTPPRLARIRLSTARRQLGFMYANRTGEAVCTAHTHSFDSGGGTNPCDDMN